VRSAFSTIGLVYRINILIVNDSKQKHLVIFEELLMMPIGFAAKFFA
jgi:hypothetical protein